MIFGRKFGHLPFMKESNSFYGGCCLIYCQLRWLSGPDREWGKLYLCFVGTVMKLLGTFLQNVMWRRRLVLLVAGDFGWMALNVCVLKIWLNYV